MAANDNSNAYDWFTEWARLAPAVDHTLIVVIAALSADDVGPKPLVTIARVLNASVEMAERRGDADQANGLHALAGVVLEVSGRQLFGAGLEAHKRELQSELAP